MSGDDMILDATIEAHDDATWLRENRDEILSGFQISNEEIWGAFVDAMLLSSSDCGDESSAKFGAELTEVAQSRMIEEGEKIQYAVRQALIYGHGTLCLEEK